MNELNCIIVEDEPLAVEILEEYIDDVPFLKRIASCQDALVALDVIQRQEVHVVFLDLHLPKLKGFDFLKTLNHPPQVIVTTAYHQYALDGYELNVVDYLIKPIAFNRFLQAVNKLRSPLAGEAEKITTSEPTELFFNVNKKNVKVKLNEILFIESHKEYIKIYTEGEVFLTKIQIGQVLIKLPPNDFHRIHRSYIICFDKITAYTASTVEIKNHIIPIGRSYRELFSNRIRLRFAN